MNTETAAFIATAAAVVAVLVLVFIAVALHKTLKVARETMTELNKQAVPFLSEGSAALRHANAELDRMGNFIETAESVGETVDAASKLAYSAFSNPLIKALAFGAGLSRGARSFADKKRGG